MCARVRVSACVYICVHDGMCQTRQVKEIDMKWECGISRGNMGTWMGAVLFVIVQEHQ